MSITAPGVNFNETYTLGSEQDTCSVSPINWDFFETGAKLTSDVEKSVRVMVACLMTGALLLPRNAHLPSGIKHLNVFREGLFSFSILNTMSQVLTKGVHVINPLHELSEDSSIEDKVLKSTRSISDNLVDSLTPVCLVTSLAGLASADHLDTALGTTWVVYTTSDFIHSGKEFYYAQGETSNGSFLQESPKSDFFASSINWAMSIYNCGFFDAYLPMSAILKPASLFASGSLGLAKTFIV